MHVGLVDLRWEGHHTPYVNYLARYFVEADHRVTFITDAEHERLDELPNLDSFEVVTREFPTTPGAPGENLLSSLYEQGCRARQLQEIFDVADEYDPDVVHLLYYDRTQVPLWTTTRLNSTSLPPVVATLHRDAFTDGRNVGPGKRLTQGITRRALNATLSDGSLDCLTVHADSIRDRIIDCVPAATRTNTRTIPAPTPLPSVDVTKAAAREHLDLPADEPIALFFGGLREEKGPDLLAEAVRGLDRSLTVVFAGPPADYTESDVATWQERVRSPVRIVDRVEFVPESDVDYYFVAADVLVLPYRRQRGISGPLRRACAVGTPVIGNEDSDIGSIIDRHNLGWTFDGSPSAIQDALVKFLDEYEGVPRADVRRFAERRHWRETGRLIESVYRDVV